MQGSHQLRVCNICPISNRPINHWSASYQPIRFCLKEDGQTCHNKFRVFLLCIFSPSPPSPLPIAFLPPLSPSIFTNLLLWLQNPPTLANHFPIPYHICQSRHQRSETYQAITLLCVLPTSLIFCLACCSYFGTQNMSGILFSFMGCFWLVSPR